MFVYYILGASFLSICYAESDQAISSFSYERGDVPLSYKYNLIHIYTTSKPEVYSHPPQRHEQGNEQPQSNPQLENYRYIQYAPLPLNTPAQESHHDYNTEPTSMSANEQEITTPQEHVQHNYIPMPTVPTQAPNYERPEFVKYAPRYSLNLQPLNDNFIQNGLYSNPNLLIKNKQVVRLSNFTPQIAYQTAEKTPEQQNVNVAAKAQNQNILYTILSHQYGQNKHGFNRDTLPSKENNDLQPSYYVKTPKVVLNVARTNNIAQAHPKASLNVKSTFRKLPTLPQDFFFNSQIEPVHNSQRNPHQKKHVYMIHPLFRST